ncbi:MAG: ATP-binding protein, partial [Candidatus Omnitrophica bacterium]|nr:ATP-binding protein [Candidatus Omnitrophota bacterium]
EINEKLEVCSHHVFINANEIKQIIINLCSNAYHAVSKVKGMLEVGLTEVEIDESIARRSPKLRNKEKYVRITVKDNGHGMNEMTKERIFEPFFTTKEVGEGTGMGLSVALGVILNHNGGITVDSEQDKGTTFQVYLPLIETSNKDE